MLKLASEDESRSLEKLQNAVQIEQYTAGVREPSIQHDVERMALAYNNKEFNYFRSEVLRLYQRQETRPTTEVRNTVVEDTEDLQAVTSLIKKVEELQVEIRVIKGKIFSQLYLPTISINIIIVHYLYSIIIDIAE
jgi:hypothetical protein